MQLTREEFNRIRQLQWKLQYQGNKVYNTTVTVTDAQLFWLDFMRLVFAPKFKKQNGVATINTFDQTQPVLLTDDLQLVLPTNLETAMYFANNTTLPMKFTVNLSQRTTLVVSVILILILISLNIFYGNKYNFKNII